MRFRCNFSKFLLALLFLLGGLFYCPASLLALPGEPDPTFNGSGYVISDFGSASAVSILQSDGKILTAGSKGVYGQAEFSLSRFNSNGLPDLTFGNGGNVLTSVPFLNGGATALALQSDGKIVAVGYSGNPGIFDVTLVRYNADGTLDASFDGDGIATLPRSSTDEAATGVVIQPSGKIVIGGYADAGNSRQNFFLARFNPSGALDAGFGTGGVVMTAVSDGGSSFAKKLLLQNDGKLVAVGTARSGSKGNFAAARYNADGTLDTSFGIGGRAVIPIGVANDDANSAVLQPDGKIILAGITTENSQTNFALLRLNFDGALDTTFGTGGKVINRLGSDYAQATTIQPNGKIVVVGVRSVNSASSVVVARYNSTGLLDASFGDAGIALTFINDYRVLPQAVVTSGTDKILVAGGAFPLSGNAPQNKLLLLRYQASNQTVFDFDGDGKADISVFRPDTGAWYLQQSSIGFTGVAFGYGTDKLVPADYDGDGKTDVAVYRGGTWYLQRSAAGFTGVSFGDSNDIPVPADYDGDGKADIAVFRPSNGTWYIQGSMVGFYGAAFGQTGDKPVAADYDGDGKADIAVNRSGTWYIQRSQLGFYGVQFGEASDKLVPADYDGDGKTDIAVFRPSNGTWYLQQSTNGFAGIVFGLGTDIPAAADYDGDGKADVGVFRNGTWYLNRSTQGFFGVAFGASTDQPLPNVFVR